VQEIKFDSSGLVRWSGIAIALLWLYGSVLLRLPREDWQLDDYSHGFLVPFICGYIVWVNRERLRGLSFSPAYAVGTVLIILSVLLHLAGTIGAEDYLPRFSFPLMLSGLTLFFGGWRWLRVLALPIWFFLLAIPIPTVVFNQITFPLQLIASDYATWVIHKFGIPAVRMGNQIELANMTLQVVEACSGIRSLMTLATLGVTWAYFGEKIWWRRAIIVLSVVPIAILANAARVAGTGILAYHYGPQAAEGFMHTFSGWLIFVVALLLLLGVSSLLNMISKLPRKKSIS
jgi:exosortase